MRRALQEFDASGIRTNAGLFRAILADAEFSRGEVHTRWLDERLSSLQAPALRSASGDRSAALDLASDAAAIAAALWRLRQSRVTRAAATPPPASRWKLEGRREQISREPRRRPRHRT
jgi:pyruvate carboxylase